MSIVHVTEREEIFFTGLPPLVEMLYSKKNLFLDEMWYKLLQVFTGFIRKNGGRAGNVGVKVAQDIVQFSTLESYYDSSSMSSHKSHKCKTEVQWLAKRKRKYQMKYKKRLWKNPVCSRRKPLRNRILPLPC
jgi:hypothetical protein